MRKKASNYVKIFYFFPFDSQLVEDSIGAIGTIGQQPSIQNFQQKTPYICEPNFVLSVVKQTVKQYFFDRMQHH